MSHGELDRRGEWCYLYAYGSTSLGVLSMYVYIVRKEKVEISWDICGAWTVRCSLAYLSL